MRSASSSRGGGEMKYCGLGERGQRGGNEIIVGEDPRKPDGRRKNCGDRCGITARGHTVNKPLTRESRDCGDAVRLVWDEVYGNFVAITINA